MDLSDGLEVAVKEGGSGSKTNNGNSNSGDTAPQGNEHGGASAAGAAGGGIRDDDREMASVPWGTSSFSSSSLPPPQEGAPRRQAGAGSLASPPDQRRKAAYAAVLGGAGSPRLPEELADSSWDQGRAAGRGDHPGFDGDEAAPAFAEGWGVGAVHPPVPPPPAREEMAPAEVLRVVARGVRAEFKTLQWACRQVRVCGDVVLVAWMRVVFCG